MENKDIIEPFTKLEEVQEWVFKMMKKGNNFIYRGQSNCTWNLESTFIREYKKRYKKSDYSNDQFFVFLKYFFIEKFKFLEKELNQKNEELSLLGKMQHYGNNTPLIDFTEDILVSLWFAASDYHDDISSLDPHCFKIFYFETNQKFESELKIKDINFGDIKILNFKTNQKFSRSISQKSVFVFDTLNLDKKIKSISIDYNLRVSIISWLNNLGINAISLFPDDQGVFKNYDYFSAEKFAFDGIELIFWKKFDKAIENFENATKINTLDYNSYNNWGYCLINQGEYNKAIKKLEKAIAINLFHHPSYNNWGYCLLKQGEYNDACKQFEKAISFTTNNDELSNYRSNLGESLFMKKDKTAIKEIKSAIKLNPKNDNAYNNLAYALVIKDGFNDIEKFKKTINIDSDDSDWKNILHIKSEFIDEAIQKLEKVREINKDNLAANNLFWFLKKYF